MQLMETNESELGFFQLNIETSWLVTKISMDRNTAVSIYAKHVVVSVFVMIPNLIQFSFELFLETEIAMLCLITQSFYFPLKIITGTILAMAY